MNKKIVMSLAVIAAATVVMAGGTVAYFSDTEQSTGNTFTAGNIDLKIDSQCHYNGGNCPDANSNWALTDLDSGVHKFFNFNDIKPGSWGENTISMHLTSNPAWAWLKINASQNLENGCNEPELKAEPNCAADNVGELAGKLNYIIWQDSDCSNTINAGEYIFKQPGTIADCGVYQLNKNCSTDPNCGSCNPLQPTDPAHPYCVGVAWCAGTWVADASNTTVGYRCDGGAIGNEAQGDSLNLDVQFDVVQSMNNLNAAGGPVCQ